MSTEVQRHESRIDDGVRQEVSSSLVKRVAAGVIAVTSLLGACGGGNKIATVAGDSPKQTQEQVKADDEFNRIRAIVLSANSCATYTDATAAMLGYLGKFSPADRPEKLQRLRNALIEQRKIVGSDNTDPACPYEAPIMTTEETGKIGREVEQALEKNEGEGEQADEVSEEQAKSFFSDVFDLNLEVLTGRFLLEMVGRPDLIPDLARELVNNSSVSKVPSSRIHSLAKRMANNRYHKANDTFNGPVSIAGVVVALEDEELLKEGYAVSISEYDPEGTYENSATNTVAAKCAYNIAEYYDLEIYREFFESHGLPLPSDLDREEVELICKKYFGEELLHQLKKTGFYHKLSGILNKIDGSFTEYDTKQLDSFIVENTQ